MLGGGARRGAEAARRRRPWCWRRRRPARCPPKAENSASRPKACSWSPSTMSTSPACADRRAHEGPRAPRERAALPAWRPPLHRVARHTQRPYSPSPSRRARRRAAAEQATCCPCGAPPPVAVLEVERDAPVAMAHARAPGACCPPSRASNHPRPGAPRTSWEAARLCSMASYALPRAHAARDHDGEVLRAASLERIGAGGGRAEAALEEAATRSRPRATVEPARTAGARSSRSRAPPPT